MPSAQVLESKKARAAVVTDLIKNSSAGVLVDYRGITVEEDTQLRKELREAGVTYFVEKNTMLRIALKEAGLDDLCSVLEGTTAIAVCDHDQTAPARILGKFAEAHDDKFTLKAGYVDGPTAWDGYCCQVAAAAASKARETQTIQPVVYDEMPDFYKA